MTSTGIEILSKSVLLCQVSCFIISIAIIKNFFQLKFKNTEYKFLELILTLCTSFIFFSFAWLLIVFLGDLIVVILVKNISYLDYVKGRISPNPILLESNGTWSTEIRAFRSLNHEYYMNQIKITDLILKYEPMNIFGILFTTFFYSAFAGIIRDKDKK